MPNRRALGLILVLVAIPVVGLAWWLGSPLFLDRTVDEEFPRTANATIPDSMTQGEVEEAMASIAAGTDGVTEPMPDGTDPEVIYRGQFEDADRVHRGRGTATIYRLSDGSHLLRFEDFRVTNGPDLRVLLTGHAGPNSRADLEATGYVELGRLKGNVGDQNYVIPADLVIDDQRSVVIYCRPFHVVFSVARLAKENEVDSMD